MNDFPVPIDEELRLQTLTSYKVLDTAPEVCFDEITELAAEILGCPVSFIEFMDADRQWFKSKYGLPDDYVETPRDIAICNTVICQGDLLYVPDLSDDDRFKNNPLVESEPNIRFYAGAPLITPNGQAIGTICSVDFEKRDLSINQREALRKLSKQVMAQLELRRTLIEVNRLVEEQKELSQRVNLEKENVELLLSRVLPDEIAKELQDNKRVEPKYIDECSILFTDFVGFTKLTETISPKSLIDLLHQGLGSMVFFVTADHDFSGGGKREAEGVEQDFGGLWIVFQKPRKGGKQSVCRIQIGVVPRNLAHPEKVERHDGVAGRNGSVVHLLRPDQKLLPVVGGLVKPSFFFVFEMNESQVDEFLGFLEVTGIEGCFVQVEKTLRKKGVVFQVCGQTGFPFAPSLEQTPVLGSKLLEAKVRCVFSEFDVVFVVESPSGTGKG